MSSNFCTSNNVSFRTALAVRNLLFACASNGLKRDPLTPVRGKIFPGWIIFSNQSNFLLAPPGFDLGFASNGIFNPLETLIPNKPGDSVFSGECASAAGLMTQDSRHQPSRHTDVENSAFTCHDVNVVATLLSMVLILCAINEFFSETCHMVLIL